VRLADRRGASPVFRQALAISGSSRAWASILLSSSGSVIGSSGCSTPGSRLADSLTTSWCPLAVRRRAIVLGRQKRGCTKSSHAFGRPRRRDHRSGDLPLAGRGRPATISWGRASRGYQDFRFRGRRVGETDECFRRLRAPGRSSPSRSPRHCNRPAPARAAARSTNGFAQMRRGRRRTS
jgi:hypothetical protein